MKQETWNMSILQPKIFQIEIIEHNQDCPPKRKNSHIHIFLHDACHHITLDKSNEEILWNYILYFGYQKSPIP